MASLEHIDFSGLFKLDVLAHLEIVTHSFYELGLKKFLALSSNKELLFMYINPQGERCEKNYFWDFVDNPINCMCFEPSGTWVLIVSHQKVLLVPFLPLFIHQDTFDLKWSLTSVTVLPLTTISKPASVIFWLTKDSENVLIIGSMDGTITFYSLETQTVVGEAKVSGEIAELQMCFDDSLDLLTLLITGSKFQQWKLVLEHRSVGYNWLQQIRLQADKDKKDGFIMSYIKQLSRDKITLVGQGGSKGPARFEDDKSTVEYVLKPTEYLPLFRKGSNNWTLTAQYVNGLHFLSAFEVHEGTMILESPEESSPTRTLRPRIKNDGLYVQGLWSQRLIFLLRTNGLEIHSTNFSGVQGVQTKREFSELWAAELIGDVRRGYVMSTKEPLPQTGGWKEPTFLCDLQLPRFNLESCLIITNCGAYILNTVCEPSSWLVGLVTRGGHGAELAADGLGAPVPALLRAAADMLLARGKIAPAQYLFSLSQSPPDGWVARLGVFGRLHELSMFKQPGVALGNPAIAIKLLAILLKMATNREHKFDMSVKFTSLSVVELAELSSVVAGIGVWDVLPIFSLHRGYPNLMLDAVKSKDKMCRGAIDCLLQQKCLVSFLIEENSQWLFDSISDNCGKFDSALLKKLCLWLNPLQDQLRPVMRDLKQGINTVCTSRLQQLITTFIQVASEIETRVPCPEIRLELTQTASTWKNHFTARRALSCGLTHWAVADEGCAKIMIAGGIEGSIPVHTDLIGRVLDVACGRHHTLVLTENGIYSAGDNTYGQLGVGSFWAGAIGESATCFGALLHVDYEWTAPLLSVSAGHYHSAAVDIGGRLYTWGWAVHGQLGLGSIEDHCVPQLVTKFQGRKVISVGCGACHTVVLLQSGSVWACGAGAFGQLGGGARDKSSLPVRVALPDTVQAVAVGYFHNLALTSKGQVYTWGASPQQTRAAQARGSSPPATSPDTHLSPARLDTVHVRGHIVQIAAGWHHSCLLNNFGSIYSWGLNFDGQLGSGDTKLIQLPTEVRIRNEAHPEGEAKTPEVEGNEMTTSNALIACGGDFTIFVDDDGRVYGTGNMHYANVEKEKTNNRIIRMTRTKRVIKIPPARTGKQPATFHPIDRVSIMFPFDIEGHERLPIEPRVNPLATIEDFENNTWPDDLVLILKPWITQENLTRNFNMAAKLAYHNEQYAECLYLLLKNLKTVPRDDQLYLTHTELEQDGSSNTELSRKRDDIKIVITNIIAKRIKDVSLSILNEQSYPVVDQSTYQSLPCCCNEMACLPHTNNKSVINISEQNISVSAAKIIDKCIGMFPVNTELWETCFRLAKDFYVDNNLNVKDLEEVLRKYMESNATTMAAAIMYSNDCTQYSKILSPKFYLNMCSQVMDTWG